MVNKKTNTHVLNNDNRTRQKLLGFAAIALWILAWAGLKIFTALMSLLNVDSVEVGSFAFLSLFLVSLIPILILSIFIAKQYTYNNEIGQSNAIQLSIISLMITVVSGSILFLFTWQLS